MSTSLLGEHYNFTEIVKVGVEVRISFNAPGDREAAVRAATNLCLNEDCNGCGKIGSYYAVRLQAPVVERYGPGETQNWTNKQLQDRVKQLEDALQKALDCGASGHANWNGEGDLFIEAGGFKLLKDALGERKTGAGLQPSL
jgi:hypothetical protein